MRLHSGNDLLELLPTRELYKRFAHHHRLIVFVKKGRECVVCSRRGDILIRSKDSGGKIHVDLYTKDLVLMTVDHITAKATARRLGWSKAEIESLNNKQPMCSPCNQSKSDKDIAVEEMQEQRCKNGYPQKRKPQNVLMELLLRDNLFGIQIQIA